MTGHLGNEIWRAKQDVSLRSRFRRDASSAINVGRLHRAGLTGRSLRGVSDIAGLAPLTFDDVASVTTLMASVASLRSKRSAVAMWVLDTPVPLAYSKFDLETLARIGAEGLEAAGAEPGDLLINMIEATSARDFNQIALGAAKAGIAHIALGPRAQLDPIVKVDPSMVVASDAVVLANLLDASEWPRLHTVIIAARSTHDSAQAHLVEVAKRKNVAVVRMFSPPGVLAAWMQCHGGEGLHTHPSYEVIELVDPISGLGVKEGRPGVVLWSGSGWHGSSILRLHTFFEASATTESCEACGRSTPRIFEAPAVETFADVLDATEGVDSWVSELHVAGRGDELFVWLSVFPDVSSVTVLGSIAETLGEAVRVRVVDRAEVSKRIGDANGELFGDRRAFASPYESTETP